MAISTRLGEEKEVRLTQGTVRYREVGSGEPVLFVHGLLVGGDLWRDVAPEVAAAVGVRCITPDWPLGAHAQPLKPDADVSPGGVTELIVAFLDALEIDTVTLVGNDSGGGLCQMVAAAHPQRVRRMVLTPSDCFDIFPPALFAWLKPAGWVPGLWPLLLAPMRMRAMRRTPLAFGRLSKRTIPHDVTDNWIGNVLTNAGARRDAAKFCRAVSPALTEDAARSNASLQAPVLLVWAREDRLFPVSYAERLQQSLPNARLVLVDDCYTFVPEDQPQALVEAIVGFIAETTQLRPTAAGAM